MKEKRKFPRYNVTTSISLIGPGEDVEGSFITKNVSKGGICISSIHPMEIGKIVSLVFVLTERTVNATGRVVWCEEKHPRFFENGIEFISITEENLKEIAKYISSR